MSKLFWDMLADQAKAEELESLPQPLQSKLRSFCAQLDVFLSSSKPATRTEILTKLCTEVLGHLKGLEAVTRLQNGQPPGTPRIDADKDYFVRQELDPAILEWARSQINEEEIIQGLREIRKTGGNKLADFIHELEEAKPHD
jgi:hypothetical protein